MKPCPKNPDGKPWHDRVGSDGLRCGNCGMYFPTIGLSPEVAGEPDIRNRGAMLHQENVELIGLLERLLYSVDIGGRVPSALREEAMRWLRIQ